MPANKRNEERTKKQESALSSIDSAKERVEKATTQMRERVLAARGTDLTWREIAEHMGRPLSSVYSEYADPDTVTPRKKKGEADDAPKAKTTKAKKASPKAKAAPKAKAKAAPKKAAAKGPRADRSAKAAEPKAKAAPKKTAKKTTKKKKVAA